MATAIAISDTVQQRKEAFQAKILESAAGAARAIARQGQEKSVQAWHRSDAAALYPETDPTTSIDDAQKTRLLLELDAATRALDPRVDQVIISMASSQDLVLVAASDGTMAADVRPLIRLNVSVILEENGQREQGYAGGGARSDLTYFLDGELPMEFAREAVRQAAVQLEAQAAPAGMSWRPSARPGRRVPAFSCPR